MINGSLRFLGNRLAPGGVNARLSILIYHRVLPERDMMQPSEVDAVRFENEVRTLKDVFNVLPLSEAIKLLYQGILPPRSACITFDDGYKDNLEIAAPILLKHKAGATFFVSTGYLNGGLMWNDKVIESVRRAKAESLDLRNIGLDVYSIATDEQKRIAKDVIIKTIKHRDPVHREELVRKIQATIGEPLPSNLMMDDADVTALHKLGFDIGAHTVSHPILASTSDDKAYHEIAQSKSVLEKLISSKVTLFAYPNGKPNQDYKKQHVEMVREIGFDAAVSTSWGVSTKANDRFQLPRFTPWDTQRLKFLLRLFRNCTNTQSQTA